MRSPALAFFRALFVELLLDLSNKCYSSDPFLSPNRTAMNSDFLESIRLPVDVSTIYQNLSSAEVSFRRAKIHIQTLKRVHLGLSLVTSSSGQPSENELTPCTMPYATFTLGSSDSPNGAHGPGLSSILDVFKEYKDYRVRECVVEFFVWLCNWWRDVYSVSKREEECYGNYLRYAFRELVKACEYMVTNEGNGDMILGVRVMEVAKLGGRGDVWEIVRGYTSRPSFTDRPARPEDEDDVDDVDWDGTEHGDGQCEEDDNSTAGRAGGSVVLGRDSNASRESSIDFGSAVWGKKSQPHKVGVYPTQYRSKWNKRDWVVGSLQQLNRLEPEPWSYRNAKNYLASLERQRETNDDRRDAEAVETDKDLEQIVEEFVRKEGDVVCESVSGGGVFCFCVRRRTC